MLNYYHYATQHHQTELFVELKINQTKEKLPQF